MARRGPLAGRYWPTAAMVVFALVPFLGLASALGPIEPTIGVQLHMSVHALSATMGLANAAYAVGTVLAVALQRFGQRRLLVVYTAMLVAGSVLSAAAVGPAMFAVGHVLQGLSTSLLLIAAAPPLVAGFPQVSRLRWTSVIMNLGIFGAVAAGPFVGEAEASFGAWRPLFWIVAAIAMAALVLAVLTFEDVPAINRNAPIGLPALGLAAAGCVAAFFGAAELATGSFEQATTLGPLFGGLALIVTLIVYQYRGKRVILDIRSLATTMPVAGIVLAVFAAAAAVSAIVVDMHLLASHFTPLHLGLLYLPELGAAVITAAVFGAVFNRRSLHYLPFFGMACLAVGTAVMALLRPSAPVALVGSGLVGLGVGAAVVPALFIVGWSVRSSALGQAFAIVELLRAVAAFMVAPILLYVATSVVSGATIALWVTFGLSAGGAIVAAGIYVAGAARPVAPAMQRWFGGQEPGWDSPPLLARLRRPPLEHNYPVAAESSAPVRSQEASVTQGMPKVDPPLDALSALRAVNRRRPNDGDAA